MIILDSAEESAKRREIARRQWNAEAILRSYPSSYYHARSSSEINEIISRIHAANELMGFLADEAKA